jgi:DNA repair exonuclease SbcCD ATPase subunit
MSSEKETCPKCGAELKKESHIFAMAIFVCGSKLEADFTQSDRCRITELEKEVERLRGELTESVTVMNGCKGLLFKSSEFMNRLYACVDRVSALLEKKG